MFIILKKLKKINLSDTSVRMLLIAILTVLVLAVISPFFKNGFPKTDDGEWMIIRFSAFHQTLANGQIPPRFLDRLNHNYGYPVTNYLYPLPFYLAEAPYLVFNSFTFSIKAIFIISTLASVLLMYWALSQKFSIQASLLGAIVYLYFPYRLIDLYVRGSLGEIVAFVTIPLIFGSLLQIKKGKEKYFPVLSIGIFALVTSHNVMASLFVPIFLLLAFVINKEQIAKCAIFFAIGISMSAFFWLPAIHDLKYVKLTDTVISNPSDHLTSVVALLSFRPTESYSTNLYAYVGALPVILCAIAIYLILKKRKEWLLIVSTILICSVIFLMSNLSNFAWRNFSQVDIIQFPWRLSAIVMLFSSILTAYVVNAWKKPFVIVAVLVLLALSSSTLVTPETFVYMNDEYYSTNEDSTTVQNEYMPVWVKNLPTSRADSKLQKKSEVIVENEIISGTTYKAFISSNQNTSLTVNTIYFPGHEAFIDNNKATIKIDSESGLINLDLPAGSHEVIIKYGKTNLHTISEVVSVLSFIILVFISLKTWRKRDF